MATNIESFLTKAETANSIFRYRWRKKILITTTLGIGLAVIYSAIAPSAAKRKAADFDFPHSVTINSWQQVGTKTLPKILPPAKKESEETEIIKSSKSYDYVKNGNNLTVDIRYVVGTRGDVKNYLQKYTNINSELFSSSKIKQIPGIGYHLIFSSRDRVYLSSCISPRAASSVTQQQFSKHRYIADWQLTVWVNWLKGKNSIRDRRCLWTHLSLEKGSMSSETADRILETAWLDWYRWWLPRFPNL